MVCAGVSRAYLIFIAIFMAILITNHLNKTIMKKIIVAFMALCAVMTGFTSCEKKADPASQPIAGHTYRYEVTDGSVTGYVQLTFHLNYKCTYESLVPPATEKIVQSLLVWEMTGNDISIKAAQNTNMPGVEIYHGVYNASAKTIALTITDKPSQEPVTLKLYQ